MTNDPFSTSGDGAPPAGESWEPERDRWGRYLLPNPESGRKRAYTRATTFAKSISDTFVLSQWGQRMVAKGLAIRPDLYALAAATPLDNRDGLNKLCEDAKSAAGAKEAASLGTALHAFTEQVDRGEHPTVPEQWAPDLTAYTSLVTEHGLKFAPEHIERIVVVPEFDVAGTFDRLAQLTQDITVELPSGEVRELKAGTWVVLDLKTGRDLSYGWNEIAIQLALYSRAAGMFNRFSDTWDEVPELDQDTALVVHLPVGRATATLYGVDIKEGWAAARLCALVREWRKVRTLAAPIAVAEAVRPTQAAELPTPKKSLPAATVHAPSWPDRMRAATSKAEVIAVWKEAKRHGKATDELKAIGDEQVAKFATA